MCCSRRGAVFFLASLHLFFAVTQMVKILPLAVTILRTKFLEALLTFIVGILFFATGFMTFRGADEESSTLIRLGAYSLIIVMALRFVLMSYSVALIETLPEATFLYVYGTPVIPIVFTLLLYIVYLGILLSYHNELKRPSLRLASPINFNCSPRIRQSHFTP